MTTQTETMKTRPPLPPFTRESAIQKVRLAEDAWNTRDAGRVALAYAIDSRWRNRSRRLEHSGRGESGSGIRDRFTMEEPLRVR